MPSITIDGIAREVPAGTTVLEAAREAGVRIHTLCYLKDVSAVGSCRVCVVDVEGLALSLIHISLRPGARGGPAPLPCR